MSRIYVAVDLETTGLAAERDAILEIGAVKFRVPTTAGDAPAIVDRWTTLVHPDRPVPYRITRLTGISQAEVERAPRLSHVLDELRAFIGNYPVIGHNVAFELAFLQRHGLLVGQAHLDTFELASILLPDAPRYSLGQLATYLGIEFTDWHRALADAEMAAHLFIALWHEARTLPTATLESIVHVALESRWPLRSFFSAALRAGPSVAAAPERMARARPSVPEGPLLPTLAPTALPLGELAGVLKGDGPVARSLPTYEARAEQIAMLDAVASAFARERHLIIEAGTGIGKGLAYLTAAIYQATTRGEPVVISTNTLNLQDQLFYQDLPLLAAALDRPFTAVRLKGKSNYVCPRRVEMLRRRGSFSEPEARLLARVLVWLGRTESGDRAELHIQNDEEPVWEWICADSESCRADRCAPYGTCHWLRARSQAEGAHLIVVNHALLLTDLAGGGGLIPPYQDLIVDEAHHLEEQATQQFGYALRRDFIYAMLARAAHDYNGRDAGLLATLRRKAAEHHRDLSALIDRFGLLVRQVEQCRQSADDLFDCVHDILESRSSQEQRYLIQPEWRQQGEWRQLGQYVDTFCSDLRVLGEGLTKLERELYALGQDDPTWQELADENRRLSATLDTICQEIERILIRPDENDINWITVRESDDDDDGEGLPHVTLYRSPIHVAPLLREYLFEAKRSVILTSATLGMEGSFAFLRDRLGIDSADEVALGSPYDFRKQALVYVAEDLPEPNQPNYANSLHRALIELLRATEGRALVLFTSKSQLRAAYRAISDPLANDDIVVLGQYMDGSRTQLLERFRTMERAVLLGTHSFWEGVDVPGPALSCLVITRLPFPVPTDPIQAARSNQYADPFLEYAVPQTVIRFRQGFGRLLRATSDRGVVALLDSRLESKRYGRTFLNSLPPTNLRVGPFRALPPLAARWLRNDPAEQQVAQSLWYESPGDR